MSDNTFAIEGLPPNPPDRGGNTSPAASVPPVVVHVPAPGSGWKVRVLTILLIFATIYILQLTAQQEQYFAAGEGTSVREQYHSGSKTATERIVRIEVNGVIMTPFSDSTLDAIKTAAADDRVKGVLLVVNSPGGLVTTSHQIYRELVQLREKKPIYVSMKDMATSGGYYISMGAGPEGVLFAEPTTWTGSIGVIVPRYNVSELAKNLGVSVESLKTGALKDSLSPFRDLTEEDLAVWNAIIDDSFARFVDVIHQNRATLDEARVRELATGQIYTAQQALDHGLVDRIGYEDDALAALRTHLQLENPRVVTYVSPPSLLGALMGGAREQSPEETLQSWMQLTVPRAMYFCSWLPVLPAVQ